MGFSHGIFPWPTGVSVRWSLTIHWPQNPNCWEHLFLGKKLPVVENLMLFGKKETHLSSWEYYFLGGKKKNPLWPSGWKKVNGDEMRVSYINIKAQNKMYGYPIFWQTTLVGMWRKHGVKATKPQINEEFCQLTSFFFQSWEWGEEGVAFDPQALVRKCPHKRIGVISVIHHFVVQICLRTNSD